MRVPHVSNSSCSPRRYVRLMLCLLLISMLVPQNYAITFAEGSKELNATGGRRPNLFWSTTFVLGGISGIGTAPIKVFAKAGETINLGSSAVGLGTGVINYRNPAGTSGTCGLVGLISNYVQEQAGPAPNAGGYTPCIITAAQTTAAGDGVWEVDFVSPKPSVTPSTTPVNSNVAWTQSSTESIIRAWDITVRNAAGATILGRAFANNLPIYAGGFSSTDGISPVFFVQTRDGYLYRVALKGVAPGGATFFANRKGFTSTTTGNSLYGSVSLTGGNPGTFASTGAAVYNPNSADDPANNDITHKIFFETPATDLPVSAPSPKGTTWLLNPQTAPPTAANLAFAGIEGTPGQAGTSPLGGNYTFATTAAGNGYAITIDLNNNGTYGDGIDRTLAGTTVAGTNTAYWDGLDRNGTAVAAGTLSFNAQVSLYAGEVHFPFLDAENNYGGFVIQRLTGPQTNAYQVFYNDTNVCAKGETGCSSAYGVAPNPRSALAGIDSSNGAHIYGCVDGNGNNSAFDSDECFGDRRAIDTWVYYPSTPVVLNGSAVLKQADLATTITHTPQPAVPGAQIQYTITVSNNGPSDVTGVRVSDIIPSSISNVTWTCAVTTGSGACGAAAGSGNTISTSVNLANGATATYVVIGTLSATASGNVLNTVSLTRPNDVTDPNTVNNSATDSATITTTGTVSGVVFNDLNGDGVQNNGELGLGNVAVQLVNSSGTSVGTTTAANGTYSFATVQAGAYTVQETDPANYTSTTANSVSVNLPAGGTATANFGDQQQGTVSGVVFVDTNGNGVQDAGETGLNGVTVQLTASGGGNPTSAITANGGVYSFANVTAGAYTVQEIDPAAYTSTTANSVAVSVPAGGSATANFGDQAPGTVAGSVFSDANGNGVQDTGETGLNTVTVQLLDNTGAVIRTATTANGGVYSFAGVPVGSYTVRETDPGSYISTTANTVAVSIASNGAANAQFGDQQQGTVSGSVFNDANGNGQQDSGEQGIQNVAIGLFNATTGQLLNTVSTDINGAYVFTGVTAASYTVRETDPAGYTSTTTNNVSTSVPAGGSGTANFGDQQQGTVSGTVFNDLNGNGVKDAGEAGIGGVTVQLTPNGGAAVATTTVGDGTYSFRNVTVGSYTVQETDPSGYTSITVNSIAVNVLAGGSATGDFGDQQQGTVSGTVFNDLNGDGTQDSNEAGIGGVTVQLTPNGGAPVAVTTAGDGTYSFTNVTAGSYTVQETDPGGYTSTSINTVAVSVPVGGGATANFGDQQQGTVSGTVFNDLNSNGTQDPNETGIGGVTVTLTTNGGAQLTTTTAGNGAYSFANVTAGNYTVQETDPAGYRSTTGNSRNVVVSPGGSATANYGDQQQGTVSGTIFSDTDGDGVQDADENGLGGVTVSLVDGNGTSIATATTVGDGTYRFDRVSAGNYTIQETDPAGYTSTTVNSVSTSVAPGGSASANFGDQQQSAVSGTVFSDVNGNGTQDSTESGLGGIVVRLLDGNNALVASTTTVGDGSYSFKNVTAGSYTVQEIDPNGYVSITSNTVTISLSAGGAAYADFGDQQQGTVSGTVFSDSNGNGTQDPNETGLGGITVQLVQGGTTRSITTVGDGSYSFKNVTAGSYTVQETDPSGYTSTTTNIVPISVPVGGSATANFGDEQQGTVAGVVFSDVNGDGFQNNGEPGLGSVVLQLINHTTHKVIATTTTAGDGSYRFDNVTPGAYTVDETDPAGYIPTTTNSVPINLTANGTANASFGDQAVGTISGTTFNDVNGNGTIDSDERGIGGVVVELRDQNNGLVASATTTGDGVYTFLSVKPGTYLIKETTPSRFVNTTVTTVPVSLGSGDADTVNFGNQQQGSISGTVFSDVNGDGFQNNGESGLGGVVMQLLDSNGNLVASTTTVGDGSYSFASVTAGNYIVKQTDPSGYLSTTNNTVPLVIAPNGAGSADFGDQQQGIISGVVFNDNNGDQRQDSNENGLGGVVVQLVNSNNVTVASSTTAADGRFTFTAVTPGAYTLRETDPNGFGSTTPNIVSINVAAGGADTANFGDQQQGTIGGRVFNDLNGNGVQEPSEPGIDGITVQLFAGSGEAVGTTSTNGDGTYTFPVVGPGSYAVRETDPPSFVSTTNNNVLVNVAPGGTANAQFGDQEVGSVTGTVFNDFNGDGEEEPSESGIGGVTVRLVNAQGNVIATQTTATDGSFIFTGVTAGSYAVKQTDPAGYVSTTNNTVTISVPPGGAAHAQFGDKQTGTVTGVVFNDTDGNGSQDNAELGVGGVAIALVNATNGNVIATATTAGDGTYLFIGVTSGSYKIQQTDPPGYVSTTSNTVPIALMPGGTANAQFGDQQVGMVSGTVFNDLNTDGLQDQSEPGLGSVVIILYAPGPDGMLGTGDDVTVASTATVGDGSYVFTGITAGSYQVREIDPTGYVSTTTNIVPISVAPGGSAHANFGDQQVGTVSGIVFSDIDGNGSQDPSEAGIGGAVLTLFAAGPDGILGNTDDIAVATTTTAGDGSYLFNGVTPGTYVVQETDPTGYRSTTSQNIPIYVAPNGAATANFGDQQLGSITGKVYQDVNGVGSPDPNEPGLGGVTIQLIDVNQQLVATTTTAENGEYSFVDVPVGAYTTKVVNPSGYTPITPQSVATTITSSDAATASFGVQQVGTISGEVFNDINGDGVPDPDEEGIGGATVELLNAAGASIATTTTANDGSYAFTGVPLGSYTVQERDPDGFVNTTPNTVAVTVANATEATANFGDQQVASISGEVFNDLNANKKQDSGEPGIGSVVIELLNASGVVVATTITAGDGSYIFTGVTAGSYTVRENDPPAFSSTTPNTVATTVTPASSGSANFGDNIPTVPTAIALVSFSAIWIGNAIQVRWVTSAEIDTFGFHVLRSNDGTRVHAQRVTPELILAKGRGQDGATYTWMDTSAKRGNTYTYWLQEIELEGKINEYGPTTVGNQSSAAQYQIWLPLVKKN